MTRRLSVRTTSLTRLPPRSPTCLRILRSVLLGLQVCLASLGCLAGWRRMLCLMRGEQAPPVRHHVTGIITTALRVLGMAVMLPAARGALARGG